MNTVWKVGDEFRGESKVLEDHQWSVITSKLAKMTRTNGDRMNNLDYSKNVMETKPWEKVGFEEDSKFGNINLGLMNLDIFVDHVYNMSPTYLKSNANSAIGFKMNSGINKYANSNSSKEVNNYNNSNVNNNAINNNNISGSNNTVQDIASVVNVATE